MPIPDQAKRTRQPQSAVRINKRLPSPSAVVLPVGTNLRNLVNNAFGSLSATLTGSICVEGRSILFDNNGAITLLGAGQGQTFSRIAIIVPTISANGSNTISNSTTDNASNGSQWYYNPSTGVQGLNKANAVAMGTAASGISINKVSYIGVTYDGATVRFFANGNDVGSAASAQIFSIDATARIGSRNLTQEAMQGHLPLYYDFSGKVLSPPLMCKLTANPWQIFAPVDNTIYADVPAVGGGSATPLIHGGLINHSRLTHGRLVA